MEKIVFITGMALFVAGAVFLIISGILNNIYNLKMLENFKNGKKGQQGSDDVTEGNERLVGCKLVAEKENPGELKACKLWRNVTTAEQLTSSASLHLMMLGSLAIAGSSIGYFENKILWIGVLFASAFVPRLALWPLCCFTRLIWRIIYCFIRRKGRE